MAHPIQVLIDQMNAATRLSRADYHLTLGAAIKAAEALPPSTVVRFNGGGGPTDEHSYRGYYSDLAFETGEPTTAEAFLAMCKKALGATYEGYKGGDFVMDARTPLWRAAYGDCGEAIVSASVGDDGALVLQCKPESDE